MTNPIVAGTGMVGSVAGGVVGAVGAEEVAATTATELNYRAGLAQINAQLADIDKNYVLKAADPAIQQTGFKTGYVRGMTTAGIASGDINVGSGSARAVTGAETQLGQLEAETEEAGAEKQAFGLEVQKQQEISQAALDIYGAQAARTAGTISAVSSVLGGVGSVAPQWLQASRQGIFG